MTVKTSHKWATVFIEIETDGKAFVIQACSQKSGEFKALDLTQFIDEKYYELMGTSQIGRRIHNAHILKDMKETMW